MEAALVRLLVTNELKSYETNDQQSENIWPVVLSLLVLNEERLIDVNELQLENMAAAFVISLVSNEFKFNETNDLQKLNMFCTLANFILFVLLNFIDVILEHPLNMLFADIPVKSKLDKSTEVTTFKL